MSIYAGNAKYTYERSLSKAIERNQITENDKTLIENYIRERAATKNLSENRIKKIVSHLVTFRKYLQCEYNGMELPALYDGISRMKNNGYKQNTQGDFIRILKPFWRWMSQEGHIDIPERKFSEIQALPVDYNTTEPDELLTFDEVQRLIKAAETQDQRERNQAFLSVLYESGCRISELAAMKWRDLIFDDYGIQVFIRDIKTKKRRYTRLTQSKQYLAIWRNRYPGKPSGDNLVFISKKGKPLQYAAFSKIIQRTAARAGITKHISLHLFRKSRITHMVTDNYQESVIKKTMWNNLNTAQFSTYVKLSRKDIDNEFLEKQGIKKKDETEKRPKAVTCGHCHEVNPPAFNYCAKCGKPLTEEARAAQERMVTDMLSEVRSSPLYDMIDDRLDKVKKELLLELMSKSQP